MFEYLNICPLAIYIQIGIHCHVSVVVCVCKANHDYIITAVILLQISGSGQPLKVRSWT